MKPERKVKCTYCNRMFLTTRGMKEHWLAKHGEPQEPSFASRLIDAQLEIAMGGYVDDDLIDHL